MIEVGREKDDKGELHWMEYDGRQYAVWIEGPTAPAKVVMDALLRVVITGEVERAMMVPAGDLFGVARLPDNDMLGVEIVREPRRPYKLFGWPSWLKR